MKSELAAESNPDAAVRPMRVAVVIPSFRAATTISSVVRAIGPEVSSIYVVDDGCPQASGMRVLRDCCDERLIVLFNDANRGVGGAMKRGYRSALADGADIVVKIDADGQMDPAMIPRLVAPIAAGEAEYAKGNRFAPKGLRISETSRAALAAMPPARRLANRLLSMLHVLATGYHHVQDPANGFTAIHRDALVRLQVDELADCFFFETDMLFQLNRSGTAVVEVAMPAHYPGGGSNLRLATAAPRFARLILVRGFQRLRSELQRRDSEAAPAGLS